MPSGISKNPFEKAIRQAEEMRRQLPEQMASHALKFFDNSFKSQGYTDQSYVKWKEVQRHTGSHSEKQKPEQGRKHEKDVPKHHFSEKKLKKLQKAHDLSRLPILIISGELRKSVRTQSIVEGRVTIISDLPYSAVHNEGLHAGRGKGFTMPRRQFMGPSAVLDKELMEMQRKAADRILK